MNRNLTETVVSSGVAARGGLIEAATTVCLATWWFAAVRVIFLRADEITPPEYVGHAFAINAALLLVVGLCSMLFAFGTRCLIARWAGAPGPVVWFTRHWIALGLAAATGLVWLLHTQIGFRVVRETVGGQFDASLWELLLVPVTVFPILAVARWAARGARWGVAVLATVALTLPLIVGPRPREDLTTTSNPSARRRPNIIVVLVDTLRADHLGVYGYRHPTSPEVDRFAADSVVYERAFSTAPFTLPACASLMTSRFPQELGLTTVFSTIQSRDPLLAELLRAEGYRTGGVASSVFLSPVFGFHHGLDHLDIGWTYLRWTGMNNALLRLGLSKKGDNYPRYDAGEMTDRALDRIEAWLARGRDPFFLYLHYTDPHAPYRPPAQADRWREFASAEAARIEVPPFSPTWEGELQGARAEALVARYDAEIAYFDREFGRLIAGLEEKGVYDESLIVFVSDHGEEFGEHGGWAHGHSLYNELIRVPLIVHYPERFAIQPHRTASQVSLVDVLPTVGDLLGASWQDLYPLRGSSLLDQDGSLRYQFARAESPRLRSVSRGRWKLIQALERGGVTAEQVFDLDLDLQDRHDLIASAPEDVVGRLREVVEVLDSGTLETNEVEVDPRTLEELRSLGYIN